MAISKIACVGAGLIGSGWATLFLSKGYTLALQDSNTEILENAVNSIQANLEFQEKNNFLISGGIHNALKRIRITTDLGDAVSDADYIQESVPDDLALKHQVFKEIDALAQENAIIASSSSGLLMTDIQQAAKRPERCVMVHPFLPVQFVPLVEIGGGPSTSPAVIEHVSDFMKKMGKTPVVLKKEVPGYIVNRLQAAVLREAIDLVDKGVAGVEDIDTAFCKGCGLRDPFIGPFLRVHLAGGSIENFFKRYDQSYKDRLKTMGAWTSFPPSAVDAVINDVNKMKILADNSMDELKIQRDNNLVQLLKITEESWFWQRSDE